MRWSIPCSHPFIVIIEFLIKKLNIAICRLFLMSFFFTGISMLSVQVKRISARKIQDQLPDYDWSESLDPLSNPHLLEWLRDQERAHQVRFF